MIVKFGKKTQAFKDGITFLVDDDVKLDGYSFRLHNGYVIFSSRKDGLNGNSIHRWLMDYPDDKCIDHINRDPLDNRMCNLRVCNRQENSFNTDKHKDNTSGWKGITFHKNKYRARIVIDGKSKHLGYFNTAQEAHDAYCEKAKELHGDFFYNNIINESD